MKNYNMILFLMKLNPWPIIMSISIMLSFMNLINMSYSDKTYIFLMNMLLIILCSLMWWKDVILESSYMGKHNKYIMNMMMYSMILFILSEILFFISFFWTFFNSMFSPDIMLGSKWPPTGIYSIKFMNLPMLNSLLLLSSGFSITWSHMEIIMNNNKLCVKSMILTIKMGIIFMMCQIFEYKTLNFSFSDSIFGSIFFISTGFHGLHVMIGIVFLIFQTIRIMKFNISMNHMMGYEFSIWYWHFVDLVWLYLYMMIYWLGMWNLFQSL